MNETKIHYEVFYTKINKPPVLYSKTGDYGIACSMRDEIYKNYFETKVEVIIFEVKIKRVFPVEVD